MLYILGGYFNNYVLSVRTKSKTHLQEWREEWTADVNRPSDPPDSNRGGVAFDGLLEL